MVALAIEVVHAAGPRQVVNPFTIRRLISKHDDMAWLLHLGLLFTFVVLHPSRGQIFSFDTCRVASISQSEFLI